MRPSIGLRSQTIRKKFVDTFIRSNLSGTPGRATDGSLWSVLRGTFGITSNKIVSASLASDYPLAVIEMGVKNASVELTSGSQGATAALWVTDSGNWWGVQTFSQAEDCNCYNYNYECNCGTTYFNCNCSEQLTNPGTCSTCSREVYAGQFCLSSFYCIPYYTTEYYPCDPCYVDQYSWVCQTCSSYSCQTCVGYACNTCYPQYVRLIKSVNNTVSSIWSQVVGATIAAFRAKTSGNVVTVQAYSDSNLANKIGSDLTYTTDGSSQGTKFGLAISPSSYSQGLDISKIVIDRN